MATYDTDAKGTGTQRMSEAVWRDERRIGGDAIRGGLVVGCDAGGQWFFDWEPGVGSQGNLFDRSVAEGAIQRSD